MDYNSLVVGILGSLIASIIFSTCQSFNDISKSKKRIFGLLYTLQQEMYSIQNHLSYPDDFNIILTDTESMRQNICLINSELRVFHFKNKFSRQVFYTILYELLCFCEYCANITIGENSEEEENNQRIQKIKKRFFFKDSEYDSKLIFLVEVLIKLLKGKNVKEIFANQNLIKTVSDIDCLMGENSYKQQTPKKTEANHFLQENGISYGLFKQRISKIIEGKSSINGN